VRRRPRKPRAAGDVTLYLQDIGVVNALGTGKAEVLRRLLAGDQTGMVPYGPLLTGRSTVVAAVRRTLRPVPAVLAQLDCRNNRLLACALDEIAPAVAALRDRVGPKRIAVLIGTSTSGIAAGEDAADALAATGRMPDAYHYRQQEIGSVAEFAARYLGLDGLRYTISTACSSSAKAFASAQRLLAAGRCDAAIVGGADSLCRLTLNGFDALESLARGVCNPFSLNRRGINIGEGACVFVLTREPAAVRLCGVGESSDGYHMSAPDPSGKGAELAIRGALEQAGVTAADVGYVNLHGTATPKNDEMESQVVARVFGDGAPCASTKALIGHTLGAAGAQELGLCWLLLSDANASRALPAHAWDGVRDPKLDAIDLVSAGAHWRRDVFLSNSFAFGGSNTTVAIGRA
jgi:3-oxoacyl-[acyl-carrier-protein] synthase I